MVEIDKYFFAKILYDGNVSWNFPAVVKSSCLLDVQYFPWDQQICPLKYGSWTFSGFEVDLKNSSAEGDTSNYIQNGEWHLVGIPARRHVEYYGSDVPYPDVTFYIIMRRKPLYYVFNLILPCIFIMATALLAFYLPPESGEKVSLGVTVLLALTVFLLMVADAMPPQSNAVPLMGSYFNLNL